MKKQILYFALLLQATSITLSFDPFSMGLFAGAVALFSSRQKALDENKKTPVYEYDPSKVKFEHPQDIIAKQLKNQLFFDKHGQLTQNTENLTRTNFTENPEFLENLKKSKAAVKYYNDHASPLLKNAHKIDSSKKDTWWTTQIMSVIRPAKANITIDQEKEAFGRIIEIANKPKALSSFSNTNETQIDNQTSIKNHVNFSKFNELYSKIYEKHKNAPNPWRATTKEFSEIVTYTPNQTKFIQVAKLDKSVPLATIPSYRQFPWLSKRFTTPEACSNETTAYSKARYLFEKE